MDAQKQRTKTKKNNKELVNEAPTTFNEDGFFILPTSPGLGTDLDESVFTDRPFHPNKYKRLGSWNAEDNSVNDV